MDKAHILSVPTIFLSFLSICGSVYACKSSWRVHQRAKMYRHNTMFVQNIFLMAFCDGLNACYCILNWMPNALTLIIDNQNFDVWHYNNNLCKGLAIFHQFMNVSSSLLHFLVAISLLYLVLGYALSQLMNHKFKLFFVTAIVAIILTVIPLLADAYGELYNGPYDRECWITKKLYQIVSSDIATYLSLGCHFVVVILVVIKDYKQKNNIERMKKAKLSWELQSEEMLRDYNRNLRNNLTAFVVAFIVVRVLPATDRLYAIIFDKSPPFGIVLLHDWCLASVGIGDGIVWYYMYKKRKNDDDYGSYSYRSYRPEWEQHFVQGQGSRVSQQQQQHHQQQQQQTLNRESKSNSPHIDPINDYENEKDSWVQKIHLLDSYHSVNSSQTRDTYNYPISYERMVTPRGTNINKSSDVDATLENP